MTQRPTLTDLRRDFDVAIEGDRLYGLMEELYPICSSITGDGFRQTLDIVSRFVPDMNVASVPSGTEVFDWTVPQEWNIQDAYVKDPTGTKVIDFAQSNLHVVNYSEPVDRVMPLSELRPHLHSLPDDPTWIPYRTSYYKRSWGFCLTHDDYENLVDGDYQVHIDSSLTDGELNFGEVLLPGASDREVLISTHACHPSLCNDNLSGVVVSALLAEALASVDRHYSYRFLFIPGGIGSVAWLYLNQDRVDRIDHGLVLNCLGAPGPFHYKMTRRGDAVVDKAALNALRNSGEPHTVIDFSPYGYDERNFSSARFDLPMGSLTRLPHAQYPGYHTSADDLGLVQAHELGESLRMYLEIIDTLERDATYLNLLPDVEPQLGKRGLYGLNGGLQGRAPLEVALLWVMNQSDGTKSLLDISDRSGIPFDVITEAAGLLLDNKLIEPLDA